MSTSPAERAPTEIAAVAANLSFVQRTVFGIAVLCIGLNVLGVLVIAVLTFALNATATSHQFHVLLVAASILTAVSVVAGVSLAMLVQRRTLRWLLRGDPPDTDDARRALRMPLDLGIITAGLWTLGALVMAAVAAAVGQPARAVAALAGGVVLAGFVSAGFTYLVLGRFNQPIARLALAAAPPKEAPLFGLRTRLLMTWLLTSALPLVGLALVLGAPPDDGAHVVGVGLVVVALAIVLGGLSTALTARAIGTPLRGVVEALRTIGEGHLDVRLELDDAGEIGLVQNGVNDMAAGLRERDRVTDLFGRHVGPAVAAQAISSGVTLSGESREVVALFVDITGSTKLTRITEPTEFVAMLNRFFEVVIEEVEGNGGLLNKFEGDAALCVFGAPGDLDDAATAALRTARTVRDRVAEMADFEVGIGVAAGPVVAGQIGSATRLEYTVIGDAVNEAARLTDLAKRVDGRILASAATIEAADDEEAARWVKGRSLRLRGRDELTHSYRTVEAPAPAPASHSLLPRRVTNVARAVADLPHVGRD